MNDSHWISAIAGSALLACVACKGPVPSVSKFEVPLSEKGPGEFSDSIVPCEKPNRMAEPVERPLRLSEFKKTYWGTYVLDEVHVYQRGETLDGEYIGSFYGRAVRNLDNSDFELKMECQHKLRSSTVIFRSGVSVPVPNIVHPRSGRVDDSGFSLPMVVDVHFDSLGVMSYENLESPVDELSDALDILADDARIYRRNGRDGFEIRFTREGPQNLGESDLFQATTTVLVTYRPE